MEQSLEIVIRRFPTREVHQVILTEQRQSVIADVVAINTLAMSPYMFVDNARIISPDFPFSSEVPVINLTQCRVVRVRIQGELVDGRWLGFEIITRWWIIGSHDQCQKGYYCKNGVEDKRVVFSIDTEIVFHCVNCVTVLFLNCCHIFPEIQ